MFDGKLVVILGKVFCLRIYFLSISWIIQESGNGPVPGCCKHGHEYFGYIEMQNFLSSSANVTHKEGVF
jgi:hypothetical protein